MFVFLVSTVQVINYQSEDFYPHILSHSILHLPIQSSHWKLIIEMAIAALYPYISHFHVMSYDYAVSDVPGAGPFSP